MEIEQAVEVFVRALCFSRSFTYPYLVSRVGGAWRLHDDPPREGSRNEEWVAYRLLPAELDELATRHRQGKYALCVIRGMGDDPDPIKAAYRDLGYRLQFTEPFFVHSLSSLPSLSSSVRTERVADLEMAHRLAKAARSRQILSHHLKDPDPPIRQYVATDGAEMVGWVKSIVVGDATWVSNLYVKPEARRRGIGKALMARMLADDKKHGSKGSVLLASHTGAKLYPLLGYEQIGELMLFKLRKPGI